MNQNKATKIRTSLEEWTTSVFTILGRVLISLLVIAVLVMVYKGLNNDHYIIQPFQVPGDFEDKGYNGTVLSRKVQDRVKSIKEYISSSKKDSIDFEANLAPDLEVGVMGFGLSLNTVTFHIKNLIGKENKIITGELTNLSNKMEMTIRMSGFNTAHYSFEYEENANEALDYLLEEAAKTILKNTDPYRLAVYFYRKKDYQASLNIIMDLIKRGKELEWAYLAWANLLNQQGKMDESVEKLKKVLEIRPDFEMANRSLAWNYFQKRDYGEATLYFEKIVAKAPNSFNGWNGLAQCYRQLENKEKAMEAYDKAIIAAPNSIWGYANKASFLLHSLKDTVGATILYQKAADSTPEGMGKYIALAGAYMAMNQVDKVMEYIDKGLEIDPNYSLANQFKINILTHKKKYKEALTYLDKMRSIPDDAKGDQRSHKQNGLNSLAMACYHLKDYDQALILAKESIAANPNNPWPYTTLAETYSYMGRDKEFYEALEEAFSRGALADGLLDDAPYQRFLNKQQFKDLVKKHSTKKGDLEQLTKN